MSLPYHRIHRLGAWGPQGWWRALAGVLLFVVAMLFVVPLVLLVLFVVGYVASGADAADVARRLVDSDHVTPGSLAYLNLSLAAAIPVTWVLTRTLHGLPPRWLASVRPRIRWRWFAVCLGLAVVALVATVVVSTLVPDPTAAGGDVTGGLNAFTSTTRDFVLVVLLLTPLQAAGEEYAFRGYLTQAFGGLFDRAWVAVLVPALLFALAHGAQDPPTFLNRLLFGIAAGVLVIATGGLEAGIAMHVLNNWLAFGLALAFGDITSALHPTDGTWWGLPVTLTQSGVYTVLAIWVARRTGLGTRADVRPQVPGPGPVSGPPGPGPQADGPVLEGPAPRV